MQSMIERIDALTTEDWQKIDTFDREALSYCRKQITPERQKARKEFNEDDTVTHLIEVANNILRTIGRRSL